MKHLEHLETDAILFQNKTVQIAFILSFVFLLDIVDTVEHFFRPHQLDWPIEWLSNTVQRKCQLLVSIQLQLIFVFILLGRKKKLMYNDEEEVQAKTNNVQIDHAPNLMQNFINWNEMKQKSKINN